MAPMVSAFLLLGSALVSARSDYAAQSPFARGKDNVPMTISARSDISVCHLAEIAEADIAIRACDADRSQAEKWTNDHVNKLQDHFKQQGLNSTVAHPTFVRDAEDDDEWDDWAFRPRHGRKERISEKDEEDDKETEESFCGSSTLTVTVHDFDSLPQLSANLSAQHATAKLQYVDWKLTNETQARQRQELRKKALAEMISIGKDYAEAMGVDSLMPKGLDEQYGFEDTMPRGRGRRYWRMARDEVDLSVPEVHTTTEFKFEYTV